MSSYLSNLLTHTTSKYNSLRRTLLSSEDDGDTEDDTHICRVLRAYYTEKGRQFPQWLPPDPNDRRSVTPQTYGQQSGYYTSAGGKSQYGAVQNQGGNRGSLNDLWDTPSSQNTGPAQPQSLRNARRPVNSPQPSASSLAPQARPLPSQRAGSYQTQQQQPPSRPGSGMSGQMSAQGGGGVAGGSAQERLKQRLWGAARAASPAGGAPPDNTMSGQGGAPNSYYQGGSSGGKPYDSGQRYGR